MSTVNGFQVGSETLKYNYESLENYNTPNFSTSSSTTYTVGDYVMYNGKLYKCTTATTGGTWVGENWTEAVLSDDVSDLSRHLNDKQNAPATAGTAGQVLGLDDQLQPVWTDGGSREDAAPVIINTASGDIASFADGADNRQIRKIVGTIVPQQSGTGDPSPDNVRPISGWTGCEITKTGRNLFNKNADRIVGGERQRIYIKLPIPNGTRVNMRVTQKSEMTASGYYFGWAYDPSSINLGCTWIYSNGQWSNAASKYQNKLETGTHKGEYGTYISAVGPQGTIYDDTKSFMTRLFEAYDIEIYYDDQGSDGEVAPYQGETLPINWQTEAGTIYGGTVTLNEDGSADVEVTGILDRLNPTANESVWQGSGGGRLTYLLSGTMASYLDSLCNQLAFTTNAIAIGNDANLSNYIVSNTSDGNTRIVLHIKDVTDKASTLQYLQNNNVMLYRGLNSAVNTYHLTPEQAGQLYTYLGTNNVWIDTGAITECDYPADTKLYIDGLTARDEEITESIAPIENGTTASKAYAAGDYFFHDTKFCKALTAIARGATFTSGTNYTETTVAAELLAAQN